METHWGLHLGASMSATRFKLDQNRLCHSGFEDNELDILLYLCQQDEEFLKGYGYSLEQIEKCLTFLKANRQPALDRYKFYAQRKHRAEEVGC